MTTKRELKITALRDARKQLVEVTDALLRVQEQSLAREFGPLINQINERLEWLETGGTV